MAKHIVSTLAADQRYAKHVNNSGVGTIVKSVLIRGGAGIALPSSGQRVITPGGIRTQVSDEDAAFLAAHGQFKLHQERGFVRIENIARDPETVAQKMEQTDPSKPKTPEDVRKDAAAAAAKNAGLTPAETLQVVTNKDGKK